MKIENYEVSPALLVIDMQNGFASRGGSYDDLGIEISIYREVIDKVRYLVNTCRRLKIPIFYTQAVREPSGIDLLTKTHKILPKSREERIKKRPICIRGTWDAGIIDELKPSNMDHIVIKRRDSAFQDTEIEVWLKSIKVDTLIFCGIDTAVSVESSLRDGFNRGYDVILISDATTSISKEKYESTLDNVKGYYGLVMHSKEFIQSIKTSEDKLKQH
ncbi:MAG TPA: isochorismatase family cysteine hydrolase [Nitrososphaeraceae archaeon]|jgi:ureidoacrylate peracid hydrolase|nr:isochorismatase family cysteine hydrolase [Nitrososphaeraceae archaeon]